MAYNPNGGDPPIARDNSSVKVQVLYVSNLSFPRSLYDTHIAEYIAHIGF